jgi:hypothetical protein
METHTAWAHAYARQADADFQTFERLQPLAVPACHKRQFLQMACEKLVKSHLCGQGTDPVTVQASHAYIARTLPIVLREQALFVKFVGAPARKALKHAKQLCHEIELLAPAVKRGGKRPDNCEYPWTDEDGNLHVPLDWTFYPGQLLLLPAGFAFLKLLRRAIDRCLTA